MVWRMFWWWLMSSLNSQWLSPRGTRRLALSPRSCWMSGSSSMAFHLGFTVTRVETSNPTWCWTVQLVWHNQIKNDSRTSTRQWTSGEIQQNSPWPLTYSSWEEETFLAWAHQRSCLRLQCDPSCINRNVTLLPDVWAWPKSTHWHCPRSWGGWTREWVGG